jgi:site-specific recombinase XerD
LYVREQLTGYHRETVKDIPYHDKYLQFMVTERGCKLTTAENNLKMLQQFARFLQREHGMASFEPTEITPSHIRRYLVYLKNELGNSANTRNAKLAALGSYYFFLECYEYIEECEDPTLLIRRASVPRRLPIHLTLEEAEALLAAAAAGAHPERDIAILRVMMQTGVRVGELIRLRVQDLDFRERTLFIQGKGNRERLVPLTKNTCIALKSYLEVRLPALSQIDALFLNQLNMPLRQGALYLLFHQLCREAGVQKPRLSACHLRHTCMTLLFQQGADLMALKKLAGHKSVRTTQVYLRVSQTQLREAMKKHPLQ